MSEIKVLPNPRRKRLFAQDIKIDNVTIILKYLFNISGKHNQKEKK